MQYPLCRHIKTNGRQCQSPALEHSVYCYFHDHLHRRHSAFRHAETTSDRLVPGQHIELSPLEDRESVQLAISTVVNALATGRLDIRRATAILYGLQLASHNAGHLNTEPYAPNVVLTVQPSPDGLDLAEPGAVIEIDDSAEEDPNRYAQEADEHEDDQDEDEDAGAAGSGLIIKAGEEYSPEDHTTAVSLPLSLPSRSPALVLGRSSHDLRQESLLPGLQLTRQYPARRRIARRNHPRVPHIPDTGNHLLEPLRRSKMRSLQRQRKHSRVKIRERRRRLAAHIQPQTRLQIDDDVHNLLDRHAPLANVAVLNRLERPVKKPHHRVIKRHDKFHARSPCQTLLSITLHFYPFPVL